MENNENTKKETQLVFNLGVSRELLRRGCVVKDLKPAKDNKEKTIAVFLNDEHFQAEFKKIKKEIAISKMAQNQE